MNALLAAVIEAHGGQARWKDYQRIDATIVSGGGFFALKGLIQDSDPRRMSVWLHRQRATVEPFGAPGQRGVFEPERVAIIRADGATVAERAAPRDSFAGHQMSTPWDPLHRAYFNGEALWTYLTTPFALAMAGVQVEEVEPWREGEETWRCLRARFPSWMETHSQTQEFYFGPDLLLRRHDYRVNIAGGFQAAQLTGTYIESGGIKLPSRRRAHIRAPDGQPVREMLMVYIDLSEVSFV